MSRQKGSANFSGTIEVNAGGALDARSTVPTKADLTASGTFPYWYLGMQTFVVAESKRYTLIGSDPTNIENWREDGANITIDSELSDSSTNPVQNKVVKGAIDGKISTSAKGTANGVAELDANGKVPAAQLPSYVDDVVEGYYKAADDRFYEESTYETLITPESGKAWVDVSTNKTYRWTGSGYARVDEGVQLGETSDTAYRGDRGKAAYDDSQTNKTNIGTMSGLNTTDKSSLVAAINEVKSSIPDISGKQDEFQFETMPTASADYLDMIVQFVGVTDSTYTNGYFYECVESSGVFSWVAKSVQAGGGGGGGHTIEDESGTDVTDRDTMQFTNGLKVSDDSTHQKTVVEPDTMGSGDMEEIIKPLPISPITGEYYSTKEQVVGQWINGDPLYQKTIVSAEIPSSSWKSIVEVPNADVKKIYGIGKTGSTSYPLPYRGNTDYFILEFDSGYLKYISNTGIGTLDCEITIQYTKTTD